MSNLFANLEREAFRNGITPRTKQSREWFKRRISSMRSVNRNALMREEGVQTASQIKPGAMVMFFYDAKHKKTLPYYDAFPLTVLVDKASDGFYGLNLHYLPPALRAKFLDGLMDIASDNKFTDKTKFDVEYSYLKKSAGLKYFEPCFKHYLTSQMKSKFAVIPSHDWEIATFLGTASVQGASKSKVYSDSRKKING